MKIQSSFLTHSLFVLHLFSAGCATVLLTDRGPIRVDKTDVREKVWITFDKEYKRDIEGKANAKLELKNYCERHVTEEKNALWRIEKEITLKKKYQELSKDEKLKIGDDISREYKSIYGNDINRTSLDLMVSAHTLVGYTIEAMEEWCQEKMKFK